MGEFLKSYGTLILAVYATVQVWIAYLWRRFVRRGTIKIYETGTLEVGYSNFGPTLGLHGTLRSLYQDVFVGDIRLELTRLKDNSQHRFRWLAFRQPQVDITGNTPASLEIPSGFMVTSQLPHRYNIVFNDTACLDDIRPIYENYLTEWNATVQKMNDPLVFLQQLTEPAKASQQRAQLIQEFRKSPIMVETYGTIQRLCYWDAGEYALEIQVIASNPNRSFTNHFRFNLAERDARALQVNVISILELPISDHLQKKNYPLNFAYPKYEEG